MTAFILTLVTSRAVDQSKADPDGESHGNAEPDRQALIGHEPDHDQADEACDKADAEIELPDHQRVGEPRRDDRGQRRLAQNVEKVRTREERVGRHDREEQDHQQKPEYGAVARQESQTEAAAINPLAVRRGSRPQLRSVWSSLVLPRRRRRRDS